MKRVALVVPLALLGCEAPFSFPAPVASVTVAPLATDLPQGDQLQLTATVQDSAGQPVAGRPVLWTSSDPVRLPVSATGLVTAIAAGAATISATVDGVSGGAQVRVIGRVARVTIDQGDITLVPGGVVPLVAAPRDSAGLALGGRVVTWASSDTLVARVSSTGLLEAVAAGGTTVTATVEGARAAVTIRVARVRFTTLSAGEFRHTCALGDDGRVWCWGENGLGQLGVAALAQNPTPIGSSRAPTFADVSAGGTFTCARTASGAVECWGSGARGRLGNGTAATSATPTAVSLSVPLFSLSSGWNHSCGIGGDEGEGGVCWGEFPQVGGGPGPIAWTPVSVPGAHSYLEITAGEGFSCGLGVDSLAYCWGMNFASRLGVDALSSSAEPVTVRDSIRFTRLATGGLHACGLASSGEIRCWGDNRAGQLGAGGTLDSSAAPQLVAGGLSYTAVAAGSHSTCAIATDGEAYCWGANDAGQLGAPSSDTCGGTPCSRTPLAVAGSLRFTLISVGDLHACGLAVDGTAYCWGKNDRGQLGDGTLVDRAGPVRVLGQP
jgi:alpha-tubulin suppressor-like RCC1 family protein